MPMDKESFEKRFLKQVEIVPTEDCHNWAGSSDRIRSFDGQKKHVRQIAWELWADRSLADGEKVVSNCGNAKCVNIDHISLETEANEKPLVVEEEETVSALAGTNEEEAMAEKKKTKGKGKPAKKAPGAVTTAADKKTEKKAKAKTDGAPPEKKAKGGPRKGRKLTAEIVREIRAAKAAGTSGSELAKKYDVHQSTISDITRGAVWKDA